MIHFKCRIQTFELTGFFGIYPLPGLKQREVFIYDLVLQIDLIYFRSICISSERPSLLLSYRQFIISTNVIECYMI